MSTSKRRKVTQYLLTLVFVGLIATALYTAVLIRARGWPRISDAMVTVNGHVAGMSRVYASPDKKSLLIDLDTGKMGQWNYVNLGSRKEYMIYGDEIDFTFECPYFVILAKNPPSYDWMLNEDSAPKPNFKSVGTHIEFDGFIGHAVVSDLRTR